MDLGKGEKMSAETFLTKEKTNGNFALVQFFCFVFFRSTTVISLSPFRNWKKMRTKNSHKFSHTFFLFQFQLRGLTPKQVAYDANHLLKKLNLTAKANEYGHNLSGGMKRRLCLGIALIGNTK